MHKHWKKSLPALLIWPLLALSLEAQQLPDWQEGWMDIHHIATSQGDCILLILPDGVRHGCIVWLDEDAFQHVVKKFLND